MDTLETEAARTTKGATLSDTSARKEFGLTHEEIVEAINRGVLHYRINSVCGNPFLRLIRNEVEALIEKKHGGIHLHRKKIQAELARIEKTLRSLKKQAAELEKRKVELLGSLDQAQHPRGHRTTTSRRVARRRAGGGV